MPPRHLRRRHAARFSWCTLGLTTALMAVASNTAHAQSAPAAPAATPTTELSAAERAKRDADKVFQWIRIMSDKPRKPGAGVTPVDKPAAGSPSPTKVATKPAARPPENPIIEKAEPVLPAMAQQTVPMTTAIGSAETASAAAKPESVTNVASLAASSPTSEAPSVVVEQDAALVPVV